MPSSTTTDIWENGLGARVVSIDEKKYALKSATDSCSKIYNVAIPTCKELDKEMKSRLETDANRRLLLTKVISHIQLGQAIAQDGSELTELANRIQDAVAPIVGANSNDQPQSIFDLAADKKQLVLNAIDTAWSKTLEIETQTDRELQSQLQKNFDLFIELLKAEAHRISTIAKNF